MHIQLKSFSYLKGIPVPANAHGGGYVFDCRGLDNPGLDPQLAPFTGLQEPIQTYFEARPEMATFIELATRMVGFSVAKYLAQGYSDLSVFFGCTGGRHRSVYAAEGLAAALKKQFPELIVAIEHTNI